MILVLQWGLNALYGIRSLKDRRKEQCYKSYLFDSVVSNCSIQVQSVELLYVVSFL